MKRLIAEIVAGLVIVGLVVTHCNGARLTKLQQEAAVLDTVQAYQQREQKQTRATSDSILAHSDSTIPTAKARTLIRKERQSCDVVATTCEAQKANLRKQVAALQPARLNLFIEPDYAIPQAGALLNGSLSARLGLSIRLSRTANAYVAWQQPLAGAGNAGVHVGVRKELRLF